MKKPVAHFWYGIEPQPDGVVRVCEAHVDPYYSGDLWLVRGGQRDLVVNTGTGIVPPRAVIEALARNPVLAVVLDHAYDHAGGLYDFPERAAHRLSAEALAHPTPATSLSAEYVSDAMLRALPRAGYSTAGCAMRPAPPTRLLDDGDTLDLGGRSLAVLHVPGTSRAGAALWEEATGSLFASGALYDDPLGRPVAMEDEAAHAQSLRRLRALPVRRVYAGHFGSFDGRRMVELIDAALAGS